MLATISIVGKIQVNDDESGTRRTTYLHFARRGGAWECTGVEQDGRTTAPPPCFSPNAEVLDALERGLGRLIRYLVKSLAVKDFNVPAKVRQTYLKRVRRRWVRKHRLVTNPWLSRLYKDAARWHEAKPAAYQGGC